MFFSRGRVLHQKEPSTLHKRYITNISLTVSSLFGIFQNGKLQSRRLAVSPDNRCLLITTNRVKSLKSFLKAATGNTSDASSTKVIDISRIDRILEGQLSNRFLMQHTVEDHSQFTDKDERAPSSPDALLQEYETTSLTIVYRLTKAERMAKAPSILGNALSGSSGKTSSNASFIDSMMGDESVSPSVAGSVNVKNKDSKGSEASSCAYYGGYECLDLCVTNERDFKKLSQTLHHLVDLYKEERKWMERSVLLFQHHWVDMGRTSLRDPISISEWVSLCNRLNAPLDKADVKALYKDMQGELKRACKELGTDTEFLESGLPPWAVSELLKDLHFQSTTSMGLKYIKQDPTLRLWHEILESDPVSVGSQDGSTDISEGKISMNEAEGTETTISPIAFLSFIRSNQKQFKATIEDATELIEAIHAQSSFKDLAADMPSNSDDEVRDNRLTRSEFMDFLLSDTNDLMDPTKGRVGSDDMTHPLSSYWIMTSHDTYLDCWEKDQPVLDEQMYLAALNRGVKCLELDIYDGPVAPDGISEPVVARGQLLSPSDPHVNVRVALRAVRQYLLANKKSFPIILNIENHCSYLVQEKLANYIYRDLGAYGLIVVPDNSGSMDASDLLPSPHSMKGRVLIMGKRPAVITDGAKVVNDDYDDENDMTVDDLMIPHVTSSEDEEVEKGVVVGFDVNGPICIYNPKKLKNVVKHSPGELLFIAKQELQVAELKAAEAAVEALSLKEQAKATEKKAIELVRNTGLADEAVAHLLDQLKGNDIDPDAHLDTIQKTHEEGVEVSEYIADVVDSVKLTYTESNQYALQKAEETNRSLQKLNHATARLREAEALLETSYVKGKKVITKYQKAAREAREKQENAAHAHRRVEKLRQMLEECESGSHSANNVVNTAMTEAKISEKRAAETEARAARAAATAQKDRLRAEEESRKEEILEQDAGELHDKMLEIDRAEKEMKMEAENAAKTVQTLENQIKLIETSSQYVKERSELDGLEFDEEKKDSAVKGGKAHAKHAAKVEERRQTILKIEQLAAEIKAISTEKAQAQEDFEKKAHQWKKQAEVANRYRRILDKSAHAAEDLAEHAEEEREAANLRKVARDRAQSHVLEKGSYKAGLEAQLKEAQRAAIEADSDFELSRKEADRLAKANESFENSGYEDIHSIVEKRKETRMQLVAEYEQKKEMQKKAEARALELKKQYRESDDLMTDTMQHAFLGEQVANMQRQEDRIAIITVNKARGLRRKAHHAVDEVDYFQSIVTEKRMIVRRAEEYKLKNDRLAEIPTQLAGMTFLHTTKHKGWEKSLHLPSTHVHSFSEGVLEEMTGKRGREHMVKLKEFTASHLCRSFYSGTANQNADPLFQWALGCQLVAMNYSTFDEHLLKADGRFRRNGSCGYALKPEFLRLTNPIPERPESWKINVLCGNCLPSPDSKQFSSGTTYINPFVKVQIYGGDKEKRKGEHTTKVVEKNGLNPIFDDATGVKFKATNPSLAILTFSVWNKTNDGEEFIAGSSMPVSCIREGYRSVPLFDKQNTRAGAYAYASLLVKAKRFA